MTARAYHRWRAGDEKGEPRPDHGTLLASKPSRRSGVAQGLKPRATSRPGAYPSGQCLARSSNLNSSSRLGLPCPNPESTLSGFHQEIGECPFNLERLSQ